jgi:uncharacterized protein Usg
VPTILKKLVTPMVNAVVMGTPFAPPTFPVRGLHAGGFPLLGCILVAGSQDCWKVVSESETVGSMVSEDFRKQVLGYGLTTAHILYRRPDHRWLLQSYIWQNYDLFPEFPELHRFLKFWMEKLEGPLHSVRVAHCKLIKPAELRTINGEFRLH